MIHLAFQSGTIVLWDDDSAAQGRPLPGRLTTWCKFDTRIQRWRAPGRKDSLEM